MIAKEYIDRIDKLNLFYLFFMLESGSQWRQNCSGSWGIAFTSAIWAVGQADTSAWGHTTNTNVQFNTSSIWTTDGYNGPCIAVGV